MCECACAPGRIESGLTANSCGGVLTVVAVMAGGQAGVGREGGRGACGVCVSLAEPTTLRVVTHFLLLACSLHSVSLSPILHSLHPALSNHKAGARPECCNAVSVMASLASPATAHPPFSASV